MYNTSFKGKTTKFNRQPQLGEYIKKCVTTSSKLQKRYDDRSAGKIGYLDSRIIGISLSLLYREKFSQRLEIGATPVQRVGSNTAPTCCSRSRTPAYTYTCATIGAIFLQFFRVIGIHFPSMSKPRAPIACRELR